MSDTQYAKTMHLHSGSPHPLLTANNLTEQTIIVIPYARNESYVRRKIKKAKAAHLLAISKAPEIPNHFGLYRFHLAIRTRFAFTSSCS